MKYLTFFFLLITSGVVAQVGTVKLHSIDTKRQPLYDNGYTLNGKHMVMTRALLSNPSKFGVNGVLKKQFVITDAYSQSGELTKVSENDPDLFFFGSFNLINGSLTPFSNEELDSLYNWSLRGGRMIIGAQASSEAFGWKNDVLDSLWGFKMIKTAATFLSPNSQHTNLFNGPFGKIPEAKQGGGATGYFAPTNREIIQLSHAGNGLSTTAFLDCKTLDLVVADVDAYTTLGWNGWGFPRTGKNEYNHTFWLNSIAYILDEVDDPPTIIKEDNLLKTTLVFDTYQWYFNGVVLEGETSREISLQYNGDYYCKVKLNCGCNTPSNTISIASKSSKIVLYPNPTINETNLKGAKAGSELSVYDIRGRLITQQEVSNNQLINTKSIEPGSYWFVVSTDNKIVFKEQLVIMK